MTHLIDEQEVATPDPPPPPPIAVYLRRFGNYCSRESCSERRSRWGSLRPRGEPESATVILISVRPNCGTRNRLRGPRMARLSRLGVARRAGVFESPRSGS